MSSHSFSIENAKLYGVECAILINHFEFWIDQNRAMKKNFHEGRTWMFQSQKAIAAIYPYWTEDAVQRNIKKLLDFGVLVKGNFNKSKYDRTVWYAFKNEKNFSIPQNYGMDGDKSRNRFRDSERPIPDTNKDTNKDVVVVRESDLSHPVENVHNSKLSKDDLYRVALSRKWTPDEVEVGWTALKKSKHLVTDEIEYVGGVIKKTRITTQTKIENITKEEIPCIQPQSKKSYTPQTQYKNKNTSNRVNKKDLDSSKPRLNTYKEPILENDTSVHLLANFEAELMHKIRYSNS